MMNLVCSTATDAQPVEAMTGHLQPSSAHLSVLLVKRAFKKRPDQSAIVAVPNENVENNSHAVPGARIHKT